MTAPVMVVAVLGAALVAAVAVATARAGAFVVSHVQVQGLEPNLPAPKAGALTLTLYPDST